MATIERFLPSSGAQVVSNEKTRKQAIAIPPQRWLGIALIIVSVIGGFLTISRADQRTQVVALKNGLAAGQVVGPGDLTTIEVLLRTDLYVKSREEILGKALTADLAAGVVIPVALLEDARSTNVVAIPVRNTTVPLLARGDRIDIWSAGIRVAAGLAIAQVTREATTVVISLEVSPDVTPAVVAVLASDFTLVKVS